MADRDRVTITLGRGGQVVKRSGPVSNVSHTDYLPSAGSKRSIRDRLGSNGSQLNNKRQRGDGDRSYLTANGVEDIRIGKDDLRFKLMQKNLSRGNGNERVTDLRDKLSRTAQPHRGSLDVRQRMPDPKDSSVLRRIPSSRSSDDLPQMDSMRSSYSGWTSDRIRRRSPDGMLSSSRGLSPRRNVEELQRRPLNRTYDVVRSVPFMSKDAPEISRSMNSAPFIAKSTLPTGSAKPMGPLLGQLPPPSGGVQKSSYLVDEHQTVDGLLGALGLGKYAILFKAEEVDMTALKQMGENDLKELGIPMGPRKKILLALAPRTKRQQG